MGLSLTGSTLWIIFALFGLIVLVQSQYVIDKMKALEDKILYGYAFRNLTMKTVDECFIDCYEDCFCMSFQMCKNTECQLLSSNQFQSPSALVTVNGCSYYDMLPDIEQITNMHAKGCDPISRCRFHGNLCQNGGSYVPLTPINHTTPRYKCHCFEGYTGHFCESSLKSCRAYSDGPRIPGKYEVFDENLNLFEVFCDFDSTFNMAWTLVQSYELRNEDHFDKAYFDDSPVNEDTPRWDEYRLSKSRMESIQNDSSIFRVTCNYDADGVLYSDYLEAKKEQIDIFHFKETATCVSVEFIDIRGQYCENCTVAFWQSSSAVLHTDSGDDASKRACDFRPTGGNDCDGPGEDNFGHYDCINPDHRCSSSQNATTQTWLGASW